LKNSSITGQTTPYTLLSFFPMFLIAIKIQWKTLLETTFRRFIVHMLQEYVDIWQKVKCSTADNLRKRGELLFRKLAYFRQLENA
jgi:hypothetical protein